MTRMLTKKDLQAIRKIFKESLTPLRKEIQAISKQLDKIDLGSNQEILLDLMVLIKLHHKKIKDIEDLLLDEEDIFTS